MAEKISGLKPCFRTRELFHGRLFDIQKVNCRRNTLGIVFERSWSIFHNVLWKFREEFLLRSSKFSCTVCATCSHYLRRSTVFTWDMEFILQWEGIFEQKDELSVPARRFTCFSIENFWLGSNSDDARAGGDVNKAMLHISLQTSKPICISLKFLTFEAKRKFEHFWKLDLEKLSLNIDFSCFVSWL